MEETLKRIILENQELIYNKSIITRDIDIPDTQNINILTGIRRCGKTYRLYEAAKNYAKEDILFLDFEDERLLALNALNNYDIIIDSYKQIWPDKTPVLFFDEIQSLKNWHLYVKRLFAQGYKIYITGSNANLLSSEIATYLAGRAIETRIFPFSFMEYLKMKGIHFTEKSSLTERPKLLNLLGEYMEYGGFPDTINAPEKDKKTVIHGIYDLLVYKDLASRYSKNDYLIKLIMNKLTENIGKSFSVSKLSDKIMPLYKISKPTVIDYVNLLSIPFLAESKYLYKKSFIQREMQRKVYFADNAFITLNSVTIDKSRLLENLIYNFLARNNDKIYFYQTSNNLEVDFIVMNKKEIFVFQACYSLSDYNTRKRETKALLKCMDELNIREATIITYNENEKILQNDKTIYIIPVWKLMMDIK